MKRSTLSLMAVVLVALTALLFSTGCAGIHATRTTATTLEQGENGNQAVVCDLRWEMITDIVTTSNGDAVGAISQSSAKVNGHRIEGKKSENTANVDYVEISPACAQGKEADGCAVVVKMTAPPQLCVCAATGCSPHTQTAVP